MSNKLHNALCTALTSRGLVVESIDPDLITRTIEDLTPAQRWCIRLYFGLTTQPPMTLEEFCTLVGDDRNSASAEKIWKDGMKSLAFKIYTAIRVAEKPIVEPDPDDGQIRLNGRIATEKEVDCLNTLCLDSNLWKGGKNALTQAGIHYLGDLIQKTPVQIKAIKKIGPRGLIAISVDLEDVGLTLGTQVTGWKHPKILE